MTTVIKFTYQGDYLNGYDCNQLSNATGEYVPLAEYHELESEIQRLSKLNATGEGWLTANSKEIEKLKALIQRVIDLLPHTYDYEQLESEDIKQLFNDCQEVL